MRYFEREGSLPEGDEITSVMMRMHVAHEVRREYAAERAKHGQLDGRFPWANLTSKGHTLRRKLLRAINRRKGRYTAQLGDRSGPNGHSEHVDSLLAAHEFAQRNGTTADWCEVTENATGDRVLLLRRDDGSWQLTIVNE
jgi:hypothetical protein